MTYDPTIDGPLEQEPILAPHEGRSAKMIPTRPDATDPTCRACRGRLIGSELAHGRCGDCRTAPLRNLIAGR